MALHAGQYEQSILSRCLWEYHLLMFTLYSATRFGEISREMVYIESASATFIYASQVITPNV